jgi:hypothetical protein
MNDEAAIQSVIADAASVRLYDSPPDAVIMRAIALGVGTRRELKETLGFGYDVIEKVLERNSADISTQMVGQIERFRIADGQPLQRKIEYICVDCGKPRSYGSGQRCKSCYDAKAKANSRPPRPELDANDRAHQEAQTKISEMVARGQEPPKTSSNGDSALHQPVKHGMKPRELDYDGIYKLRCEGMAVRKISAALGYSLSTLDNRRAKDERLHQVLNDGWDVYCGLVPESSPSESPKNITETITKTRTSRRTKSAQLEPSQLVPLDKTHSTIARFSPSIEEGKSATYALPAFIADLRAERDELDQLISLLERRMLRSGGGGRCRAITNPMFSTTESPNRIAA